jgi:hypothetical protein
MLTSVQRSGVQGSQIQQPIPPVLPGDAVIERVDLAAQVAYVTFDSASAAPVGAKVVVVHSFILGKASVGHFEVVQSAEGTAVIRPIRHARLTSVARGDAVRFLQ